MTLPSSGPISMDSLRTEFGVAGARSIQDFYRGAGIVPGTLGVNVADVTGAAAEQTILSTGTRSNVVTPGTDERVVLRFPNVLDTGVSHAATTVSVEFDGAVLGGANAFANVLATTPSPSVTVASSTTGWDVTLSASGSLRVTNNTGQDYFLRASTFGITMDVSNLSADTRVGASVQAQNNGNTIYFASSQNITANGPFTIGPVNAATARTTNQLYVRDGEQFFVSMFSQEGTSTSANIENVTLTWSLAAAETASYSFTLDTAGNTLPGTITGNLTAGGNSMTAANDIRTAVLAEWMDDGVEVTMPEQRDTSYRFTIPDSDYSSVIGIFIEVDNTRFTHSAFGSFTRDFLPGFFATNLDGDTRDGITIGVTNDGFDVIVTVGGATEVSLGIEGSANLELTNPTVTAGTDARTGRTNYTFTIPLGTYSGFRFRLSFPNGNVDTFRSVTSVSSTELAEDFAQVFSAGVAIVSGTDGPIRSSSTGRNFTIALENTDLQAIELRDSANELVLRVENPQTALETVPGHEIVIDTNRNGNFGQSLTFTNNSGFELASDMTATVDGAAASGVLSTYTLRDYDAGQVTQFTSSVLTSADSDRTAILDTIDMAADNNTETPVDFNAVVENDTLLRFTATTTEQLAHVNEGLRFAVRFTPDTTGSLTFRIRSGIFSGTTSGLFNLSTATVENPGTITINNYTSLPNLRERLVTELNNQPQFSAEGAVDGNDVVVLLASNTHYAVDAIVSVARTNGTTGSYAETSTNYRQQGDTTAQTTGISSGGPAEPHGRWSVTVDHGDGDGNLGFETALEVSNGLRPITGFAVGEPINQGVPESGPIALQDFYNAHTI